ncbi:uncharacterized protein LOC134811051 [Bolinopsis microptera]|uniref:uncharacterized protein LOC134811051 n=1 Tax=Bolinopsis microptera TaxID=2820187 RepID=UPI00307ADEB5
METGVCTSTRYLDYFNHTHQGAGQACLEYSGYCNEQHRCVTINLNDPLSSLEEVFSERSLSSAIKWIKEHWYYSLSSLAGLIALIVMFKYTYVRRVPIRRALTRVKSTFLKEADQMAYAQSDLHIKHHKPIPLDVAVQRLSILFPTAELNVITDTACVAATEEIAVKRLLALDYPMSRLAVTLPSDQNGLEDSQDE